MPKKFVGENHKKLSAQVRQEAAKEAEQLRKEQEAEDALWAENDKKILRKLERKQTLEKKKQEASERKVQNKLLVDQEDKALKPVMPILRLTRAQITTKQESTSKNTGEEMIKPLQLEENPNRKPVEGEEARSISEAIAILNVNDKPSVDKHPEKRRKSAYMAFQERRYEELKNENPQLKFSQLKKIIFKEWQNSPDNPINTFGKM